MHDYVYSVVIGANWNLKKSNMDEYIHEYEYSLVPKFDPDEYDPEEDGYFEFLPEDTMYSENSFCFCKIWY